MEPSFPQRFGVTSGTPIDRDFPLSARNALMFIIQQFVEQGVVRVGAGNNSWRTVMVELLRITRSSFTDVPLDVGSKECHDVLAKLKWHLVYVFCERFYANILCEKSSYNDFTQDWTLDIPLEEARVHFATEINTLLSEEHVAYVFEAGLFIRPGRPQTQKNVARADAVLADPALRVARAHFAKATKFFSDKEPDYENAVKEAVCALEATMEVRSGEPVAKDFDRAVAKLSGIDEGKIPPPIAQVMTKLHAYRGAGAGVAHGTTHGLSVSRVEAEFVLSAGAALITYIVDFYASLESEVPF